MRTEHGVARRRDRRRAERRPIDREAYFAALNIQVLPQIGRAVDVSREGLLIRTPRPLPEGAYLDVEMRPPPIPPGAQMILARGRVARIAERGDGHFDMGVQLHVKHLPGAVLAAPGPTSFGQSQTDLGSMMARLRPQSGAALLGNGSRAHWNGWRGHGEATARTRFGHQPPQAASRDWFWPLSLLLIALLLLSLWPWLLEDTPLSGDMVSAPDSRTPSVFTTEPRDRTLYPVSPVPQRPEVEDIDANTFEPDPLPAQEAFPATEEPAAIWEPLPQGGAAAVRDAEYGSASAGGGQGGFAQFSGGGASRSLGSPAARGVSIEVDTQAFAMYLYLDGKRAERFTIGLGQDGSTPRGEFTIGTKITDPDWFNRGDVIKAGDPRNLIGRRWIGLSQDGQPTPYGIHPTDDASSLGSKVSRGCIRVDPGVADTLFRLCPIGTRVVVY